LVSPLAPKSCDEYPSLDENVTMSFQSNTSVKLDTPGMSLKPILTPSKPPPGLTILKRHGGIANSKEFKAVDSHWRLLSTIGKDSIRAVPCPTRVNKIIADNCDCDSPTPRAFRTHPIMSLLLHTLIHGLFEGLHPSLSNSVRNCTPRRWMFVDVGCWRSQLIGDEYDADESMGRCYIYLDCRGRILSIRHL
jgi:hypothetical protein